MALGGRPLNSQQVHMTASVRPPTCTPLNMLNETGEFTVAAFVAGDLPVLLASLTRAFSGSVRRAKTSSILLPREM